MRVLLQFHQNLWNLEDEEGEKTENTSSSL